MPVFNRFAQMVNTDNKRMKISIQGAVQGVGFRPFVYRLANRLGLKGWVVNDEQGVRIEIEGRWENLNEFFECLKVEKPQRSIFYKVENELTYPVGYKEFTIRESVVSGEKTLAVQPDIAVCKECLAEIFDPTNRRYLYPFTNCTNCGPRFSIIEGVPYDRANTSMRDFKMCSECEEEYNNPLDRRYHSQPNACPKCGPHIELWNNDGKVIEKFHTALLIAVNEILNGKIVAVKGLGGFHLIVDAENEEAVLRLRRLKRREEKPLAVMFPSLNSIKEICSVSEIEEELLDSPESPIVLLKRKNCDGIRKIAPSVAPDNPYIGAMFPYTQLHHILLKELGKPVVATSGNITDEPICIDEHEAIKRLKGVADLFLVHNRRIVRHIDDSVAAVIGGETVLFRRARGYAPLPVEISAQCGPILAVGAHLKNAVAFGFGNRVFLSQHIGDLESVQAYQAFLRASRDLPGLYEKTPAVIVCDNHPDYLSTKYAEESGLPIMKIQHHYAHILSCVAENKIELPVLGVAWDGTGYGSDGTIWGGEFLLVSSNGFKRVAHIREFPLPGGDTAIKEPRRSAVGILFEKFGESINLEIPTIKAFSKSELAVIFKMLKNGRSVVKTSSAGRLFDAVASIIGLRQFCKYEGQSAMELEFAIDNYLTDEEYPISIIENVNNGEDNNNDEKFLNLILDWMGLLEFIINDYCSGEKIRKISARFHNSMAKFIVEVARRIGEKRIVLSGGCFQNRYLTERVERNLTDSGFTVYRHKLVPPNDGGIALGQVLAASMELMKLKR